MKKNHIPLKVLLIGYIFLTLIIATLNYAYVPKADPKVGELIQFIWEMFENPFKISLIALGIFYSTRDLKKSKKPIRDNHRSIFIGFMTAALIIHLILPLLLRNWEIYFVTMPLPWTTSGLQLQLDGSNFGHSFVEKLGDWGIALMLLVFWGYNGIVFIATVLLGRRFQCSQICLFNGFIAETFDPVLPLVGKKKPPSPTGKKLSFIFQIVFFIVALLFTFFWTISLIKPDLFSFATRDLFQSLEAQKYLTFDLLLMMIFWVIFGPRTYCSLCSAGTSVGIVAKYLGKQEIKTDLTQCTSCSICVKKCPMGLNPMEASRKRIPLRSIQCIGCARCIESCPEENLSYGTRFTHAINF